MAKSEKQMKLEKQQDIVFKILWIPIVVLLGIVPLIVRLAVEEIDKEVELIIHNNLYADFFSQYKSVAIIAIVIIMLGLLFFLFQKEFIKKDRKLIIYTMAIGIFGVITLVSSLLSQYRDVALWGYHDRAEGAVMVLCYIFIFMYTIYVFRNVRDYKYILGTLSILVGITSIIGVFQYFGKDLFMAGGALNSLVIPKEYSDLADKVATVYVDKKVYGTFYHYNYMGSFAAMMVPLFGVLTILSRGYKRKILFGIVTILGVALLLGSSSRAGVVGIAFSVLVGLIMFGKVIIKKWKISVSLIVVVVAGIIGINTITNGEIFSRIPSLVNDAIGIFLPGEEGFDYRAQLPIRDIVTVDGKTSIEMSGGTLVIENNLGEIVTKDQDGQDVEYAINNGIATTKDERFKSLSLKIIDSTNENDTSKGILLNVQGRDLFAILSTEDRGVELVDRYTQEPIQLKDAPFIGFEGKERLGSARGYIWSRTLPMLKETVLLGHGADTYALEFPQDDYMAKWWAYETPNMIVDKPHNMYLQIWVNQGCIALIAFLVVVVTYIVDSLRLYSLKDSYGMDRSIGMATMLAIVGYLGAGVFNDSVISVAPIFWILLGAGISVNYVIRKEEREIEKRISHRTINMKTGETVK